MKSFSESRVSLDIAPLSANVKLTLHTFMSRAKKTLFVLSALVSLEFLPLAFLTNGLFFWTARHVPPPLNAASHIHARAIKLNSLVKIDLASVLGRYGEPTPQSEGFVTARGNHEASRRSAIVAPLFVKVILAPKVSRYISKSVLNI